MVRDRISHACQKGNVRVFFFLENRSLSSVDFDYAFDEFKPISVKLLEDQTKKTNRMALHWSDIGGMNELKQELIQTIQWRFEVNDDLSFSRLHSSTFFFSTRIISPMHQFD